MLAVQFLSLCQNIQLCFIPTFKHQVKGKVEEFKEHMPLIQTLFNPGLRDRHWDQISDIVGYNMKPDDSYCLSKLVDMNLEPYISKFESISESASKEFSLEKAMEAMKKDWAPVCQYDLLSLVSVFVKISCYFLLHIFMHWDNVCLWL